MDLQEPCKIQEQVGFLKKFLLREKQNHLPPTEKWLYTAGKKPHQGKKFKRSIKFMVKLKTNEIFMDPFYFAVERRLFP